MAVTYNLTGTARVTGQEAEPEPNWMRSLTVATLPLGNHEAARTAKKVEGWSESTIEEYTCTTYVTLREHHRVVSRVIDAGNERRERL